MQTLEYRIDRKINSLYAGAAGMLPYRNATGKLKSSFLLWSLFTSDSRYQFLEILKCVLCGMANCRNFDGICQ